jgi:hypothetical protein
LTKERDTEECKEKKIKTTVNYMSGDSDRVQIWKTLQGTQDPQDEQRRHQGPIHTGQFHFRL